MPAASTPDPGVRTPPAGLLLTGGASRRMGRDKASLEIDGVPCAVRVAGALAAVTDPTFEIGGAVTSLPSHPDDAPGAGPLGALATGRRALLAAGHAGAAVVAATDLPFLTPAALRFLADWPGPASVVPLVDGRPQPLCARWSPAALDRAVSLFGAGERSFRALLAGPDVVLLPPDRWPATVDARQFEDVDSIEDLVRLGLAAP